MDQRQETEASRKNVNGSWRRGIPLQRPRQGIFRECARAVWKPRNTSAHDADGGGLCQDWVKRNGNRTPQRCRFMHVRRVVSSVSRMQKARQDPPVELPSNSPDRNRTICGAEFWNACVVSSDRFFVDLSRSSLFPFPARLRNECERCSYTHRLAEFTQVAPVHQTRPRIGCPEKRANINRIVVRAFKRCLELFGTSNKPLKK